MAELSCPACRGALEPYEAPSGWMHLCHRCGGAWLDNAVSARVAEAVLSRAALAHAHSVSQSAPRATEGYRDAGRVDADRRCPECDEPLEVVHFPRPPTHLDVCRAHGTFFDRDELLAVHRGVENEKSAADQRRRQLSAIIGKFRPGR